MAHLLTQRSWNETRTGVVGGVYGRRSTPEVSNPEQKDQEGRLCSSGSCSRLGSHSGAVANGAGGTQCGWGDAVAGYGETRRDASAGSGTRNAGSRRSSVHTSHFRQHYRGTEVE